MDLMLYMILLRSEFKFCLCNFDVISYDYGLMQRARKRSGKDKNLDFLIE